MSWRDSISIHAAAEIFPPLGDAELRELGYDIRRNGLTSPIAIMIDHNKPVLVDGRSRLDAMEIIGLRVDLERTTSGTWKLLAYESLNGKWVGLALTRTHLLATVVEIKSDPVEYITSVNIHRRHLMAETKLDLIAKLLKEHPERSNRATAELVKVDHKTVAAVRRREEDVGSIPHVEKVVDTKGRKQPASKPKVEPKITKPTPEMAPPNSLDDERLIREGEAAVDRYTKALDEARAQIMPRQIEHATTTPVSEAPLSVTLKEEWRRPLLDAEKYLGVPVAEYVDFLLMLGTDSFNRKFQKGLTNQIEWWLVKMHSKYPETLNVGSWEGSCGHLSIDKLHAKHDTAARNTEVAPI